MKIIFKLGFALVIGLVGLHSFAQKTSTYEIQSFPENLARYETEIFRLVSKDGSVDPWTKKDYYDPEFAHLFNETLTPFRHLDKALKRKLLSGPAPKGKLIIINKVPYVFYSICQAHSCNTTNLSILYQPSTQAIRGRLQYKCDLYPIGHPSKEEMAAINDLQPIDAQDAFYQRSCRFEKEEK